MARPRTFDEDRAVDAAMRTFWANGYEATSTRDLCAATGLGRSSIYNTFASKHELFKRALVRYFQTTAADYEAIVGDHERPAIDRLRALLAAIVDTEIANRRDGHSIGCLAVNTTVELAGRDPEATRLLDADNEQRLAALRALVTAAQRDGDVASRRSADELARFVYAVIGGLRVAGQRGADRAELESIAATAMDALTH